MLLDKAGLVLRAEQLLSGIVGVELGLELEVGSERGALGALVGGAGESARDAVGYLGLDNIGLFRGVEADSEPSRSDSGFLRDHIEDGVVKNERVLVGSQVVLLFHEKRKHRSVLSSVQGEFYVG